MNKTKDKKNRKSSIPVFKKPEVIVEANSRPNRNESLKREGRPRTRVPISIRNVLKWDDQDPAYQYRWVNDNEDRIQRFKGAGWNLVESKDHAGGNRSTGDPSKLASYVEKSVGSGTKAVLMRIDKQYYEEDQKVKQEEVDEIERSMDPRNRDGGSWEGKIEIER